MNADFPAAADRGEPLTLMAPLLLAPDSRHRPPLLDLAMELAARAAGLRTRLPGGVASGLADLVRSMNCYYSNLIEGHYTHPIDIERALRDDYSSDPQQRDLQLEATAHIAVQRWIDAGGLDGRAATAGGLREIHRRFSAHLPEDLRWTDDSESGERLQVVPGELRRRDVRVGRHVPISPGAVPRFLARFEETYGGLGRSESLLAAAAAHHRLLWIHPFLDGNGRVARLMSHATLFHVLDTAGLWSIARGLARNDGAYEQHLVACDQPRRNDLDGRGSRSEEALAAFTRFFLETCIDQVRFMDQLTEPGRLRERILRWAEEETRAGALPPRSGQVLEAVLYRGALPRGEIGGLLGTSDRHARRIAGALVERGVLHSARPRAPLRMAFPAALVPRWLPGLFPEKPG